jgi:hypothetical protein
MKPPTRLPVQHPRAPHCEVCDAPLPSFDGVLITMPFPKSDDCVVTGITFHIRCKCGTEWNLTKGAKG